jgi:hypothetical protein
MRSSARWRVHEADVRICGSGSSHFERALFRCLLHGSGDGCPVHSALVARAGSREPYLILLLARSLMA